MIKCMNSADSASITLLVGQPSLLDDTERLVRTHSTLIKRIARSVFIRMSSSTPIEDLVQIGTIALLEAAKSFEDRGTACFATYAGIRIRGAMIDELRRSATVSRQGLQNRRRFTAARAKLESMLGRSPTDGEMAEAQSMTLADYRTALSGTQVLSYESIDSGYSEYDACYADERPGAFDQLEKAQLSRLLAAAIEDLPGHQPMILQLYFVEEFDLATIGRLIDVGPARVCQLKKAALATLQRKLSGIHS